jgi:hypothetical protein
VKKAQRYYLPVLTFALLAVMLLAGACDDLNVTTEPTGGTATTAADQTASTLGLSNTTQATTAAEVGGGAQLLQVNQSYSQNIVAGAYPGGTILYAVQVPSGSSLTIGIADFTIDLDIYVDTDLSILDANDVGQWKSDAYGLGDESVAIRNPSGLYYIQVKTYNFDPSLSTDFAIYTQFTP